MHCCPLKNVSNINFSSNMTKRIEVDENECGTFQCFYFSLQRFLFTRFGRQKRLFLQAFDEKWKWFILTTIDRHVKSGVGVMASVPLMELLWWCSNLKNDPIELKCQSLNEKHDGGIEFWVESWIFNLILLLSFFWMNWVFEDDFFPNKRFG